VATDVPTLTSLCPELQRKLLRRLREYHRAENFRQAKS
jgi:hypothetical protein